MNKGLKFLIIAIFIISGLSFCVSAARRIDEISRLFRMNDEEAAFAAAAADTAAAGDETRLNMGEMEFRAIEAWGSAVVTVRSRTDANRDVILHVDEKLAEHVDLKVVKGVLYIGLKSKNRNDVNLRMGQRLFVSAPHCDGLCRLSASGAARIEAESPLQADKVEIEASGASKVTAEVDCTKCVAEASGASKVTIAGRCADLTAEASGASGIDAEECESGRCYAEASGASSVTVWCTDLLKAEASGASKVLYKGDCTCKKGTFGASRVRRIQ